ncbi:uncharacterized protein PHACADRAFT_185569 [Phanerochaete carnosa HHB-10118-sp]|uniref:LisH domain-containing protein n=1 Tax=Phanerochaete carnosa (strain HHB-10118-sp) TaxID=650164 RepID=K5WW39_PHACS|nr:uncharacterized protein PHACADRAFT_185569 [Phanerochaete carnosa HHB-10118-sp]EKM54677.1 hypothetical protein PHACADRAFT_185569 [Phanerochaete carnosa HHB-10118-sp]
MPLQTVQLHAAPAQSQQHVAPQPKARTPTPPPPPPHRCNWDIIMKQFLQSAGLTQALRGFESDMLVMSSEWEQEKVPAALSVLHEDLNNLHNTEAEDGSQPFSLPEASLDERKLEHASFRKDIEPRTPSRITRDISRFLAQNRARNDLSNRNEFLLSLAEKKRKVRESNSDAETIGPEPSCARTDARTQNRDVQMKYDIVKNEDGPLRKTLKREQESKPLEPKSDTPEAKTDSTPTAERYPALSERLHNIETHVAVRYAW